MILNTACTDTSVFITSVTILMEDGYSLSFLIRHSDVHIEKCTSKFMFLSLSFIYLFPATEPTVGPRCVARKQCPMATAEAHASTRTFLWKKQDKPVQCKSARRFLHACMCLFSFPSPSLCHHTFLNSCKRHLSSPDFWQPIIVTPKNT